jgi:putative redox protein
MAHVNATAEVTNRGNQYTSSIAINQFDLVVDEPVEKGGEDMGPAPGDYLCAALASCKAITLRMYAQRKKWDIEEIKVVVNLFRNLAVTPAKNIFSVELFFKGALDPGQISRLEVIAGSCPIHRMLMQSNEIVTTLHHDTPA